MKNAYVRAAYARAFRTTTKNNEGGALKKR